MRDLHAGDTVIIDSPFRVPYEAEFHGWIGESAVIWIREKQVGE